MEVFNQRLEQEYNASVIVTAPTVPYKAVLSSAKLIKVRAVSCSYIFWCCSRAVLVLNFSADLKFQLIINGSSGIDAVFSWEIINGKYLRGQSKCAVAETKSQPILLHNVIELCFLGKNVSGSK